VSEEAPNAVYTRAGQVYEPTRWAAGPWSATMQHGGPANGLFAREAELAANAIGMRVARLTMDLFKAVPMIPLAVETRYVREGKRIASIETVLHPVDDEAPVCRAVALLLRALPGRDPFWRTPDTPPPPFDAGVPAYRPAPRERHAIPPGFHSKIDIRPGADEAGPYIWMTTSLQLVDGEPMSPLQRATALTDMTLGSQMRMVQGRRHEAGANTGAMPAFMINTDTTVYWERPFVGDQLGLRPSLITENDGIGTAEAVLYDARGRVGRSLQSALVQREFSRKPRS